MVISSFSDGLASRSIEGMNRWCSIGCPLTKPFVSDSPVTVNRALASRRPYAASVAPKTAPGSRRGPALPTVTGRVMKISASFFG